MLADTVLIIVNINHWSNILRRTLEFDFIYHISIYKCLSKVSLKNFKMSKENDLTRTPSTSGSSPSNWNCNSVDNLNGNREFKPDGYIPNVVLTYPTMSLHNTSNFYNLNFCQTNSYYYMEEQYIQQNFNRHYCQSGKEHQIRNVEQRNDQRLLSLRKWENVNENRSNRPGFIFTLMSYNVLSQDLLAQHPYLYNRHDNAFLKWSVRWNNLFNEITKFKPDVLCLQEVQESHIKNYFSVLESIGYSSLYKRRTGERTDGCALYYKTDIIQLVEHATVEYFQPNISILNRDNVGLIAKFSPKLHPTREFVVATTHLLYNPRRQDVRLAQMQVLLTEIERISYSTKTEGNYLPVILAGDLNSTPDSAVYEFISKGTLKYELLSPRSLRKGTNASTGKLLVPSELRITDNCQHVDLLEKRSKNKTLSRSEETSIIELFHSERNNGKQSKKQKVNVGLFSTGTLSHSFVFKSVYNHGYPMMNEGTTYQDEWLTVDYIFYSTKKDENSRDKLKLLSRYRLPTKEELLGVNIPNSVVGSDHLSLMAKFKLEY